MQVHIHTLTWNEEIMVPFFLRHYDSFVDKIFINDNESDDRTIELLTQNPKVEVSTFKTEGQHKSRILTDIRRNCWKKSKGNADYVIVCDFDEFLYHPNIKEFLEEAKKLEVDIFQPDGYEMIADPDADVPSSDEDLKDAIPYGWRADNYSKLILFNPNAVREMNYAHGSHEEFRDEPIITEEAGKMLNGLIKPEGLKLLHYKDLSLDYKWKRTQMIANRYSDDNRQYNLGIHYLRSYDVVKEKYMNNWDNKKELVVQ